MNPSLTDQGPGGLWSKAPLEGQNSFTDTENISPLAEEGPAFIQSYEHQMAQFADEQEDELARLRSEYVFDCPRAVLDFLKTHRALPGLLLEAVAPLRRCFGGDCVVHLQARTDGDARILYAIVFWRGSLNSVKGSLKSFDDTWWLASSGKASGYVVFDYELA